MVKPTIEHGFDYRRMAWAHLPQTLDVVPSRCDRAIDCARAVPLAPARKSRQRMSVRYPTPLTAKHVRSAEHPKPPCLGTLPATLPVAEEPMFDAAIKALIQMFSPPFRRVLLKSIGLGC